MSILDKAKSALKSVTDSVTGGAATVALEHTGTFAAGETIKVKITATSTGAALKSTGVHVDLQGKNKSAVGQLVGQLAPMVAHSFKVAEAFALEAGQSQTFEGEFAVPAQLDASYDWEIRGRIEALGNDPDSGFADIR